MVKKGVIFKKQSVIFGWICPYCNRELNHYDSVVLKYNYQSHLKQKHDKEK